MEKKDDLTSDKLTDYHGRYVQFGQVHEFMHGRGSVTLLAQFAMELLKNEVSRNGLDGPFEESVSAKIAADLAQAWFDECKKRGWILKLPPLDDGDKRTFTSPALAAMAQQMAGRRSS
jgi:hypothetical protein